MRKFMLMVMMVLALLLPARAPAADPWTPADFVAEAAFESLLLTDMALTLRLHGKGFETNPVLGPYPTRGAVVAYTAAWLVLHPLIAHHLPGGWRPAFQWVTVGIQLSAVRRNIYVMGRF